MYSRDPRSRQITGADLPPNYGGSTFMPFQSPPPPPAPRPEEPERERDRAEHGDPGDGARCCGGAEAEKEACGNEAADGAACPCTSGASARPQESGKNGIARLLGDGAGAEELLLLGVIFLLYSDRSLKDDQLLISLLLILLI